MNDIVSKPLQERQSEMPDEEEHRRWLYEVEQRPAIRAHDRHSDIEDAARTEAMAMAHAGIKFTYLINGGAAVAILAFLGALSAKGDLKNVKAISATLIWFGLGVAGSGAAYLFGYFALLLTGHYLMRYAKEWKHPYLAPPTSKFLKWGSVIFEALSYISAVASLVIFVLGTLAVRSAINTLNFGSGLEHLIR